MIKHIVMWTIQDTANHTREENIENVRKKLNGLPKFIKEIEEYEVGVNISESPAAYDIVLNASFKNKDALLTYQNHPAHVKVKDFINSVQNKAVVVDYYAS